MSISGYGCRFYRSGNKQVALRGVLWVWLSSQVSATGYNTADDSYYKLSALYNISNYWDIIDHWQKRKLPTEAHMCTCSCKNMFLLGRGRSVQQSHRCRKHLLAHPSSPVISRPLWAAQVFWPGRSSPFHIWKDTTQDVEYHRIEFYTKSD